MLKLGGKKEWHGLSANTNGSETTKSMASHHANGFTSAVPASEAKFSIAHKLKEKLGKARELIAKKKTNPESMILEKVRIQKTLPEEQQPQNKSDAEDSEAETANVNLNLQREEGFTEKYDEHNELQRKARQTMNLLKKTAKRREPATKNAQSNPQTIPILSFQYQQGTGMALPSSNLRHMPFFDANQQGKKAVTEEKYHMKIDDPNSVLHIANYHQNKDFEHYAKVIIEDNKQFLKINAPDAFTFFRLHHELHEMNRKKTRFLDMKTKFFDNKDPEEIIQYDENLDNFDTINSDKNYSASGKKKETIDKKEHQHAEKVAKKLKETGRKKDPKTWEKDFAYGLMEGFKGIKGK